MKTKRLHIPTISEIPFAVGTIIERSNRPPAWFQRVMRWLRRKGATR